MTTRDKQLSKQMALLLGLLISQIAAASAPASAAATSADQAANTQPPSKHPKHSKPEHATPKSGTDRSGKPRHGKASYYSRKFAGKKMANGEHLQPDSNAAASKTLPIGTTAKVTNEETGKSAVVVVQDRGPYVDGRIIDVTPKTADKLDLKQDGVAPVKVTPLKLPPPEADAANKAPPDKK
jgi:rare lipoprotein A